MFTAAMRTGIQSIIHVDTAEKLTALLKHKDLYMYSLEDK